MMVMGALRSLNGREDQWVQVQETLFQLPERDRLSQNILELKLLLVLCVLPGSRWQAGPAALQGPALVLVPPPKLLSV